MLLVSLVWPCSCFSPCWTALHIKSITRGATVDRCNVLVHETNANAKAHSVMSCSRPAAGCEAGGYASNSTRLPVHRLVLCHLQLHPPAHSVSREAPPHHLQPVCLPVRAGPGCSASGSAGVLLLWRSQAHARGMTASLHRQSPGAFPMQHYCQKPFALLENSATAAAAAAAASPLGRLLVLLSEAEWSLHTPALPMEFVLRLCCPSTPLEGIFDHPNVHDRSLQPHWLLD